MYCWTVEEYEESGNEIKTILVKNYKVASSVVRTRRMA